MHASPRRVSDVDETIAGGTPVGFWRTEKRHICGWGGPEWLHSKWLCATCRGQWPQLEGHPPNPLQAKCIECYPDDPHAVSYQGNQYRIALEAAGIDADDWFRGQGR